MLPILTLSTTLSLLFLLQHVHGAPFYLLSNNRQKCVSVVSPPGGITLVIEYFAPDIVLKEDLIAQDSRLLQMQKDLNENKKVGSEADRLKSEFETSVQQLQRTNFNGQPQDMKMIVMERPNRSTTTSNWKERRQRQEEAQNNGEPIRKPSGRIMKALESQRGNVTYVSTDYGGQIDICMQSMKANAQRPSRYSLNVQSEDDVLSRQRMVEEMKQAVEQEKEQEKEESQKKAQRQLTRFQADLLGMDRKLTMILNNADDSKEREKEFQNKSIQMNRASVYWPVIHIVVLAIAGFTQVNHMISYLKSRHLY